MITPIVITSIAAPLAPARVHERTPTLPAVAPQAVLAPAVQESLYMRTNACLVRARQRGVVTVEYAFLLVLFALPVIVATTAAGVAVVGHYTQVRNSILHVGP
jgi:Flp pilus assembly pilin Flp